LLGEQVTAQGGKWVREWVIHMQGDGAADALQFGLAINNTLTTLDFADPNLLDFNSLQACDFGTVASTTMLNMPFIKDFSSLPGGGLLIPAYPLYGFALSVSVASAMTVKLRGQFTIIELEPAQYIELVEAMRVVV